MYHRVVCDSRVDRSERPICVSSSAFRTHLSLLEKWGFTSITFNDYRLALQGEIVLPKKPVIITFDDGYLDTYEVAFPIMQEFGMKAVVFILGDQSLRESIWDSGVTQTLSPLMTAAQIQEMQLAGFEFGSHSMTHPRLTDVPAAVAWEEISRSKILLELHLNAPVRTFSYPYGLLNDSMKAMVRDAGYSHACGVFTGPPNFGADNYEIRRIPIFSNTDMFRFAFRMLTRYEYYAWVRSCCRRVYHSMMDRKKVRSLEFLEQ
jgi:peptidoglycan/xylan/chitin deacetylase (PgdA/CDA1 family)